MSNYPQIYFADSTVFAAMSGGHLDSNWDKALTAATGPTDSISSGVLALTGTGTNPQIRQIVRCKATGADAANTRVRARFTMGSGTAQFFHVAHNINTDLTTMNFIGVSFNTATAPSSVRAVRRKTVTVVSDGTTDGPFVASLNPTLTNGTDYILELDRVGSGGSRTYNWRYKTSAGVLVTGSDGTSGSQSNANTDTADRFPGMTVGTPGVNVKFFEILNIAAPQITAHPVPATVTSGATASFSVTAIQGEASGTPGGSGLTYQWQSDNGGGWTNYSGGSGATTASLTTATLTAPDNGLLFRCIVTDSGNSQVHNSDSALLTVSAPGVPVSPGTTNTGGTTIDLDITGSALTLTDNNPSFWSVVKNSGTAVGITSVAIVSTNTVRLTLSGRIKASDTLVKASFAGGANVLEDASSVDIVAFSDVTITNISNVDFALSISSATDSPYTKVPLWKGGSYVRIRVPITRTNHTTNLTLSATGLPTGVTIKAQSNPVATSIGWIEFQADNTVVDNLPGGTSFNITASDGFDTKTQAVTLYVADPANIPANAPVLSGGGASTFAFLAEDNKLNPNLNDLYAGTIESWTYTDIDQTHPASAPAIGTGTFGQKGSGMDDWQIGAATGYMQQVKVWSVQNYCRYFLFSNVWANTVSSDTWAGGIKTKAANIYHELADWFTISWLVTMTGRYDNTVTGTCSIVSVAGNVVTVSASTGTIDATCAGKTIVANRTSTGGKQARDISSVAANGGNWNFTLDSPFAETPTGACDVTTTVWRDRIVDCNNGFPILCEGGAEVITGAYGGRLIPFDSGMLDYGRDFLRTDKIHITLPAEDVHVQRIRDGIIAPTFLEDAALNLTGPASIVVLESGTVEANFTGFPATTSHFTDALTAGIFSVTSDTTGGAIVDANTGEVTAGPSDGEIEITFTGNYTPYGAIGPLTDSIVITVATDGGGGGGDLVAYNSKLVTKSDGSDLPDGICDGIDVNIDCTLRVQDADGVDNQIFFSKTMIKQIRIKRVYVAGNPIEVQIRALYLV